MKDTPVKIIERLEKRIIELMDDEWQARDAKDYTACLQLQGAIIQFKKFLKDVTE